MKMKESISIEAQMKEFTDKLATVGAPISEVVTLAGQSTLRLLHPSNSPRSSCR